MLICTWHRSEVDMTSTMQELGLTNCELFVGGVEQFALTGRTFQVRVGVEDGS